MSPMIKRIVLALSSEKDSELEACEYLENFAKKCDFTTESMDELRLAFIEALINAKEHSVNKAESADKSKSPEVLAAISYDGEALSIEVRDYGKGFDPSVVEKPDIRKKLKSANKRGWGLMLMEKLSDGMEIKTFPPSGTLITLVKKRVKPEPPEPPDMVRERKMVERLKYILGSFIDLSSFLCQNTHLDTGLRSMLRILLGTLGVSKGAIYILDNDRENFRCLVDIKLKAREKTYVLPVKPEHLRALSTHETPEVSKILFETHPSLRESFSNEDIEHIYLMKNDADILGLLVLSPRYRDDPEDLCDSELLATLARNISSAINTFKLMEQLKTSNSELALRVRELDAIRESGQAISSVLEIEHLPATVEKIFQATMGINTFSIVIREPFENRYKICHVGRDLPESLDLWASPVSRYVVQKMEPLFVPDIDSDTRFDYPRKSKYSSSSFIVIPIINQDQVVAIVNLTDQKDGTKLNSHDFEFAQLLCSQLNIAIKNASLYKLGFTDSLTKLYASAYFKIRLSQEISRLRRVKSELGLIMIEFDQLLSIQEKYNSLAADLVLSKTGGLIRKSLRFNDIPCRYDQNRIVAVLPDTDLQGTWRVAEKIRAAIEGQIVIHGQIELRVTASCGVVVFKPSMSMEELVEAAEKALREAKNQGCNTVCQCC
ncbi:MAG: diguanylate cyclase [Candidatus Riflebacteria bacterium]|nr:diguanylate cyclase [Candidatus Riflebacteria bacterium]